MMKKLLLMFFVLHALCAFSQHETSVRSIRDFNTYGYIGGIRLDSVVAGYATMGFNDRSVYFNYGQDKKTKHMLVTDKEGRRMVYTSKNIMFWLNFFHFNGWDYQPDSSLYILKKRDI